MVAEMVAFVYAHSISYLGDDLFRNQPFCEAVIAQQQYSSLFANRIPMLNCIVG